MIEEGVCMMEEGACWIEEGMYMIREGVCKTEETVYEGVCHCDSRESMYDFLRCVCVCDKDSRKEVGRVEKKL